MAEKGMACEVTSSDQWFSKWGSPGVAKGA